MVTVGWAASSMRRNLRMASGLVLFAYIGLHLANHSLGLISLDAAEAGMGIAIDIWYSPLGTILLYGAAFTHFGLALWAVYERRTFRLPPIELVRIALGFTLPLLLIGHAASTRLAYELFGLPSDYARIVSNLWASGAQGWQLALMAPGWLHGCLGLHLAFCRRSTYRRWRFVLFAIALLLPVLSALGFIAMMRELGANPEASAAALEFLGPGNAHIRLAISQWKDGALNAYVAIIVAVFVARGVRNWFERSASRLVTISYPGQIVRVPRGWSVLEASRAFHLPHAAMCGGRARCSTCRVRILNGVDACLPPAADEKATLDRIGATSDVRLACQLRPQGNVSVIPLVSTAQPTYRSAPERFSTERDVVIVHCHLRNRATLAATHLPQDFLHLMTLYLDNLTTIIRTHRGILCNAEFDSVCVLFGLDDRVASAAQSAVQAATAIDGMLSDLNSRLGRRGSDRLQVCVIIHRGNAAIGEIGSSDPPILLAAGPAIDEAIKMRNLAEERGKRFAISERVYGDANFDPGTREAATISSSETGGDIGVGLSENIAVFSPVRALGRVRDRRISLRRIWTG